MSASLPPEVWLSVFHHATHVPGTFVPEIYAHFSSVGSIYDKTTSTALRQAHFTSCTLVHVCKQWWHLAVPFLYRSVCVSNARSFSSLLCTLQDSVAGKGTIIGVRPLGEYTERLDIACNRDAEFDSLPALIKCIPRLAIFSFSTSLHFASFLLDHYLQALRHSATSLRVLDLPISEFSFCITDLLAKCTQLRVLKCSRLTWSEVLRRCCIPATVTTLRLYAFFPYDLATITRHLDTSHFYRPWPSALQEVILDLDHDHIGHWKDLFYVYGHQLVSVQLYISDSYLGSVVSHVQHIAQNCPRLRRLTVTSYRFSSFVSSILVSPTIVYLGLRATHTQLARREFRAIFAFLQELQSGMPSLQVVQFLSGYNVRCLLEKHTKLAVRALRPFMDAAPFRIEDEEGMLLTGS